jgi:sugar/nucleoside kinase (ribokinase family)
MHTVAVAGHICVDLRPELSGSARLAPGHLIAIGPLAMDLGGAVGNTGVDLHDLGAPVRLFTSVGDDELGRFVQDTLAANGYDVSGVDVVPGGSTSYSLILEPAGVDRTIWHNVGVNSTFDGRGVGLAGVDLLHLGYPPLLPALLADDGARLDDLLSRARASGATTSVDLAYVDPESEAAALDWHAILARMAGRADVLSPSLDDISSALRIDEPFSLGLVDRMQDLLLGWGAAVVALSAGDHGLFVRTAGRDRLEDAGRALSASAAAWADRAIHVPPVWTDTPVTTNGAGDASSAGLVLGIAAGAGAEQSALMAAACSGAIVSGRRTTRAAVLGLRPDLAPVFDAAPVGARP